LLAGGGPGPGYAQWWWTLDTVQHSPAERRPARTVTKLARAFGLSRDQQRDLRTLLALSDERDRWEAWSLLTYREGFAAGQESMAGQYAQGYSAALTEIRRQSHGFVGFLKDHLAMWGGHPRGRFADPRPGDWPGTDAGKKAVAEWRAARQRGAA
jgi:hypothetical protein